MDTPLTKMFKHCGNSSCFFHSHNLKFVIRDDNGKFAYILFIPIPHYSFPKIMAWLFHLKRPNSRLRTPQKSHKTLHCLFNSIILRHGLHTHHSLQITKQIQFAHTYLAVIRTIIQLHRVNRCHGIRQVVSTTMTNEQNLRDKYPQNSSTPLSVVLSDTKCLQIDFSILYYASIHGTSVIRDRNIIRSTYTLE